MLTVEDFEARAAAIQGEHPFLLLFTSGTTGRQKGVRLSQDSIVRALEAGGPATARTERDIGLHLLPFGHIAGHDQFVLAVAQGHTLLLIASREDLQAALALRPTYLFSVPLVYERIRMQVLAQLDRLPGPLRRLLHGALEAAMRFRVERKPAFGDRLLTRVLDALLGRKVRTALGGRVEGLFAGGAPASEALFRFFEALGIPMVELYGMSETAGMISGNLFSGPRRPGIAGLVTPDHEVRIAEDHELLLKGPLLLTSYLEAEDNAGAYTEDGFFRTGDLAELDGEGWLRIIGRKKHLMVLSTGKKIPPEPVETAIGAESPFEGAMLLGDGKRFVGIGLEGLEVKDHGGGVAGAVAVVTAVGDVATRPGVRPGQALKRGGEADAPLCRFAVMRFSRYRLGAKSLNIAGPATGGRIALEESAASRDRFGSFGLSRL